MGSKAQLAIHGTATPLEEENELEALAPVQNEEWYPKTMTLKEEAPEVKVKPEEEKITSGQQTTTLRLKKEFQVQLPSIAERRPSNMQKRVT